ncbi:DUF2690 domain-containing protein [Streptomyces sp. NPDC088387]|uniref:helix-turn-helix domain-containing protein n=1 Tax=Streptomyces sp. NPDC088387 TaxID=3365859 RepID=UPI00381FB0E6
MPRWKALPDELDPQIREFTSQLRRLVDRSGLNVAAVADRTGYSKTSWERYLNGRLLAPKGAIVALAEVTGTNPVHLTTMWELAERAWSRSEMRHDMTMEAIRISQARAALSEFGTPPAGTRNKGARKGGSATVTPGVAGPAGVAPSVPLQPTAPEREGSSGAPADGGRPANSWGIAGYEGPSRSGVRPSGTDSGRGSGPASRPAPGSRGAAPGGHGPASGAYGPAAGGSGSDAWRPVGAPGPGGTGTGAGASAPSGTFGEPPRGGRRDSGSGGGKRRATMFLAGVGGVLVVVAAAFFLTQGGDKDNESTDPKPSPTVTTDPELPPGVKCSGDSCTGKDAEAMGCSGDLVTTAKAAVVGTTTLEVRYSETCKAAWGRITLAAQGDTVDVSAGTEDKQNGSITEAGDTIAYTPMVAVKNAQEATACATLASGQQGCTTE